MTVANTTIKPKTLNILLLYTVSLITTNDKKNCTKLAQNINMDYDSFNRLLEQESNCKDYLLRKAIATIKFFIAEIGITGWIIGDDTIISKPFSERVTGTSEQYDTVAHTSNLALVPVVIAWTNGITTIPIAFKQFYKKEVAGDLYKSKIELMIELLELVKKNDIPFIGAFFDGLYATNELIEYCNTKNICFVMRLKSNSVITNHNGKSQAKKHPDLHLHRNSRSKKTKAQWQGFELIFATEKFLRKNGEHKQVFIVSNMDLSAQELIACYRKRWNIEKMFRSTKQKLGLKDCQCYALHKQASHTALVFTSYIFLQLQLFENQSVNVESAQRRFCYTNSSFHNPSEDPAVLNFAHFA